MDELYTRFDSTFFEKTRLSILTIIYRSGKASFNYLKQQLRMTDGALYTHVEKLIQADYLEKTRQIADNAAQTIYTLTDSGKAAFQNYLRFLQQMLESHADPADSREDPEGGRK